MCGSPGAPHNPEFDSSIILAVSPAAEAKVGIPQAIYDCNFAGIVILNSGLSDSPKKAASLDAKNSGIFDEGCLGIKLK